MKTWHISFPTKAQFSIVFMCTKKTQNCCVCMNGHTVQKATKTWENVSFKKTVSWAVTQKKQKKNKKTSKLGVLTPCTFCWKLVSCTTSMRLRKEHVFEILKEGHETFYSKFRFKYLIKRTTEFNEKHLKKPGFWLNLAIFGELPFCGTGPQKRL